MEGELFSIKHIVAAVIFAMLGNVLLLLSFILVDKLTPGNLWHQIAEEKNVPMAITVAAVILAVGMIISSAIHG